MAYGQYRWVETLRMTENMAENHTLNVSACDEELTTFKWWGKRRLKYNLALLLAGFPNFICCAIVIDILGESADPAEYDGITPFTMVFHGIGYLLMMGIANVCYYVGPISEKLIRPKNVGRYRNVAYWAGLWFSVSLPFSIPVLLLLTARN